MQRGAQSAPPGQNRVKKIANFSINKIYFWEYEQFLLWTAATNVYSILKM